MSTHADHDAEHAEGEHDHDDHPAVPQLEEPATPLWLTLLGIGLFLSAGILFLVAREDGKTTAELTAVPSAEVAAAASVPAPNPGQPDPAARRPGAMPTPGAPPSPAAAGNPAAAAPQQIVPGLRMGGPPNPSRPPGAAPQPAPRPQQPGHEGHDH